MDNKFLDSLDPHFDDYFPLVLEEFLRSEAEKYSRSYYLGCGSLPLTAFLFEFYRYCLKQGVLEVVSAEVNAVSGKFRISPKLKSIVAEFVSFSANDRERDLCLIDRSEKALQLAGSFFEKAGLSGGIVSCLSDGINFVPDVSRSVFIHIAAMVSPREEVLRNIFSCLQKSSHASRVLIRHIGEDDARFVLYEPMEEKVISGLLRDFKVRKIVDFKPDAKPELATGHIIFDFY